MERRLAAILAIAAISSTAVVSLFFREKVAGPIEILRRDWNLPVDEEGRLLIPTEEGRFAYTLSLVAREPIVELELRFAVLINRTSVTNASAHQTPHEQIRGMREVGDLIQTLEAHSSLPATGSQEAKIEVEWRRARHQTMVLDFTESLEPLSPTESTRRLHTVHAFMFDPKGTLSRYYRGSRDLFLDREETIVDITIQRNDNLTRYAQRATEAAGTVPLSLAPSTGTIRFGGLRKDDRISVTVAFNPAEVETKEALMHVVLLYVNSEYYTGLGTILERTRR